MNNFPQKSMVVYTFDSNIIPTSVSPSVQMTNIFYFSKNIKQTHIKVSSKNFHCCPETLATLIKHVFISD